MKKLVIILLLLLPISMMAQNKIDKLFERYSGRDGYTTVNISGQLLAFAAQFDEDKTEMDEMLHRLDGIKILTSEDENKSAGFVQELNELLSGSLQKEYALIMDVQEDDQDVRFYIKEGDKGKVSELLMVVSGEDNALIRIIGDVDLNQISNIGKGIHIDGLEHLEEMEK